MSNIAIITLAIVGLTGGLGSLIGIALRSYMRGFLLGMYRQAYRRGRTSGYKFGWRDYRDIAEARRREQLANARRTSEPREDAGPSARVSKARFTSKG